MQDSQMDLPQAQSQSQGDLFSSNGKPVVIGIYGLPGSGKTYLLNQLKQKMEESQFIFYEGSNLISRLIDGGLNAFQKLKEKEKYEFRQHAINKIGNDHAIDGKVAVVAGHFMFWSEKQKAGQTVYTQADLDIYTHIIYLDVPAEDIARQRLNDTERNRPAISVAHLGKWQQEEKVQLRRLCYEHGILFSLVHRQSTPSTKIPTMLQDFKRHTEKFNLSQAESELDGALTTSYGQLQTVLAMDADRTLTTEDTGALIWNKVPNLRRLQSEGSPLDSIFQSPLDYSYSAFRQAMLLYEEVADDQKFVTLCDNVASEVTVHPEFLCLLRLVAERKNIGAVVITCGLRRVWEKVLEREGLLGSVKVIGGGRMADGFVVTAAVKGALVSRLQQVYKVKVCAFGDSPLDLDMLNKANRAVVVVGPEQARSKSMDADLAKAIDDGLQAQQALLPSNTSPRLDTAKLPIVELTDPKFVEHLLGNSHAYGALRLHCATDKSAAKLLATPMRDAAVAGPNLREAHRRAGWYLGIEYLADMIGIHETPIHHVLGRETSGYQLYHEKQTTIVALMRGGEPMAYGVNDVFPSAMFVHAKDAEDLKDHHLQGQLTVILVDSVVNTGKTIVEFVEQVRKVHATIRIVVVAGVVQAQCTEEGSLLHRLAEGGTFHLVALRLSKTKFTGSGTTDTGNRLFNTTHLR